MSVSDRLKQFRESRGQGQREFAASIGTAFRTYQDYERGEFTPKLAVLEQIAALGCDLNWLVTGASSNAAATLIAQQQSIGPAMARLPVYDARFSAGKGRLPPDSEDKQWLTLPEDWVRRATGRNPKNIIKALAEGDSMAPTIGEGAELLIDKTDDRLANGKIYALNVDGQLIVKRIHRPVKGGIVLISDNKEYPAEEIAPDSQAEIQIIGQVVWSGKNIG